jgi:hypothetical protein
VAYERVKPTYIFLEKTRASNSVLKSVVSVKDIYRVRFPVYLSNTVFARVSYLFMGKCHARYCGLVRGPQVEQ